MKTLNAFNATKNAIALQESEAGGLEAKPIAIVKSNERLAVINNFLAIPPKNKPEIVISANNSVNKFDAIQQEALQDRLMELRNKYAKKNSKIKQNFEQSSSAYERIIPHGRSDNMQESSDGSDFISLYTQQRLDEITQASASNIEQAELQAKERKLQMLKFNLQKQKQKQNLQKQGSSKLSLKKRQNFNKKLAKLKAEQTSQKAQSLIKQAEEERKKTCRNSQANKARQIKNFPKLKRNQSKIKL